jgi:hypothetical protein
MVPSQGDDEMKTYFTLAVREDGRWAPQFGDYSRSVVAEELDDYLSRDVRRGDLKVVRSGDTQASIDAAIAELQGA